MQQIVEASQRQAIRQALSQHQGNWAASARQLGLDASNLHKLAKSRRDEILAAQAPGFSAGC